MRATTLELWLVGSAAATLAACGGGNADVERAAGGPSTATATESAPLVRTASEPSDPCDWIPVSEVEAAIGKLAAPPRKQDGCRYTLVMPPDVAAARQQYLDRMKKLRERFKGADLGEWTGALGEYHGDPETYAVTLTVGVDGDVTGEAGAAAAYDMMRSGLPEDGGAEDAAPRVPEGWDVQLPVPYGFAARVGHVGIAALGEAPDVPEEIAQALAERVRDRIPDLPFLATNAYQVPFAEKGPDPCGLLEPAEAEAVLGPLVTDPFRASSDKPALALREGHGCAWHTAGHRVFSIVPIWGGGKEDFDMEEAMGSLLSVVLPQDLTVIKGPWDQALVSATGALLFLEGDRLLQVHYKTSSTDMRGAIKLAAQAMRRMPGSQR